MAKFIHKDPIIEKYILDQRTGTSKASETILGSFEMRLLSSLEKEERYILRKYGNIFVHQTIFKPMASISISIGKWFKNKYRIRITEDKPGKFRFELSVAYAKIGVRGLDWPIGDFFSMKDAFAHM